jgi:hypothetical protein
LQLLRFDAEPALGLVHCGAETIDSAGRTLKMSVGGMEGRVAAAMLRLDREVIMPQGSSIVVPKRIAEEIGGFDERLPPSEDWDFCYRIAVRYEIGYVAEVLVRYRLHGSGIHTNIARMERAMLIALEKAFADPSVQPLRNVSYGRFHRVVAGCYFETRDFGSCLRNIVKSLRYDPRNLGYFACWPFRVIGRWRRARPGA